MFVKSAVAVAGLLGLAQAHVASPLLKRDYEPACPADSGYSSVVVQTKVVAYPVVINQYFEQNTNIVINGGVTININNAPTTLSTTVTATSTATVTVTAGPAQTDPIVISLGAANGKRQAGSFLGANGVIVTSCGEAAVFTIDSMGQLFSGTEQVSTDAGVSEILLAVSATTGAITTVFSGTDGFSWSNAEFFGGAASFCSRGDLLYAEFTDTIPADCLTLSASAQLASSCAALSSSSSSSSTASSTSTGSSSTSTSSSSSSSATTTGSSSSSSSSSSTLSTSTVSSTSTTASTGSTTTTASTTATTTATTSTTASTTSTTATTSTTTT